MRRAFPLLLLLLAARPALAAEKPVVVLLHARGPAFDQAVEGFRHARIPALDLTIDGTGLDEDSARIREAHPDVIVAIGDDASRFAAARFADVPRVTAMASADGATPAPLGIVAPEVPPDIQVKWIGEVFPRVSRVGIVYDPSHSQRVVDSFVAAAASLKRPHGKPLVITPIEVKSEGEVPAAFKRKRNGIEALLFVNDSTVMTKDTILYLLEECVRSGIPAIGFSAKFLDNGAVLAFVVDPRAVGAQAADAASKVVSDRSALVEPPKMDVWVNRRVADKLDLRLEYDPDVVKEFQ